MKVVCAWCLRDMGEKMGPDNLTTHGICGPCLDKIEGELQLRGKIRCKASAGYPQPMGAKA